jgi:hypothetical protein
MNIMTTIRHAIFGDPERKRQQDRTLETLDQEAAMAKSAFYTAVNNLLEQRRDGGRQDGHQHNDHRRPPLRDTFRNE